MHLHVYSTVLEYNANTTKTFVNDDHTIIYLFSNVDRFVYAGIGISVCGGGFIADIRFRCTTSSKVDRLRFYNMFCARDHFSRTNPADVSRGSGLTRTRVHCSDIIDWRFTNINNCALSSDVNCSRIFITVTWRICILYETHIIYIVFKIIVNCS